MGRLKKEEKKALDAEDVVPEVEALAEVKVEAPARKTIKVGNREITGVVSGGVLTADDGCSYGYSPEIEVA